MARDSGIPLDICLNVKTQETLSTVSLQMDTPVYEYVPKMSVPSCECFPVGCAALGGRGLTSASLLPIRHDIGWCYVDWSSSAFLEWHVLTGEFANHIFRMHIGVHYFYCLHCNLHVLTYIPTWRNACGMVFVSCNIGVLNLYFNCSVFFFLIHKVF